MGQKRHYGAVPSGARTAAERGPSDASVLVFWAVVVGGVRQVLALVTARCDHKRLSIALHRPDVQEVRPAKPAAHRLHELGVAPDGEERGRATDPAERASNSLDASVWHSELPITTLAPPAANTRLLLTARASCASGRAVRASEQCVRAEFVRAVCERAEGSRGASSPRYTY